MSAAAAPAGDHGPNPCRRAGSRTDLPQEFLPDGAIRAWAIDRQHGDPLSPPRVRGQGLQSRVQGRKLAALRPRIDRPSDEGRIGLAPRRPSKASEKFPAGDHDDQARAQRGEGADLVGDQGPAAVGEERLRAAHARRRACRQKEGGPVRAGRGPARIARPDVPAAPAGVRAFRSTVHFQDAPPSRGEAYRIETSCAAMLMAMSPGSLPPIGSPMGQTRRAISASEWPRADRLR